VAAASYDPLKSLLNARKSSELECQLLDLAAREGCSPSVEQIIVDLVQLIEEQEKRRGSISRTERSKLSDYGQVCQGILDKLMLCLIGLGADKAQYIEQRLSVML
jgi:hypothetical protein